MNQPPSTESLLEQIAQVQRMEPGKLCVMREGPQGPYYNLQCQEGGKTLSRYVPRDQAEMVAIHTANYNQFRQLVDQYAQLIIAQTRAERAVGSKKKKKQPHRRNCSWLKRRKSSN